MSEPAAGLPSRLRHARILRGFRSCLALDEHAGVAAGLTAIIEATDGKPDDARRKRTTAVTVERLARALDVTMDWLWSGLGDGPVASESSPAESGPRADEEPVPDTEPGDAHSGLTGS